jgi:hypothetical protein
MRVMVAIPHYYFPTDDPSHAYSDSRIREQRLVAVQNHQAILNIKARAYERIQPRISELALFAVTTNGRHLLSSDFCKGCGINHQEVELQDPRMLGFEAHKVFAQYAKRFDIFVYSEDDLLPRDSNFLDKILWFNEIFGYKRIVLPNRYEWNLDGPAAKTFIDGDLVEPDDQFLSARSLGRPVSFERTRNPHSGFHALTQEQLRFWMSRPHWGDQDISFVSPLESTAALTLLKTFSVYKTYGSSMDFLEVEHLDRRYSALSRRPGQRASGVDQEKTTSD